MPNLKQTVRCALAFVLCSPLFAAIGADSKPPSYSSSSIVNAATQSASGFAPYTIATIYGTNLSFTTRGITGADTVGGVMPTSLEGVSVFVYRTPCALFYVSPTQINFLVPAELLPGDYDVQVARNGASGSVATIHIDDYAPGFFAFDGKTAIATHPDGRLITADAPAAAGEIVVFYVAGLGITEKPLQLSLLIPAQAKSLPKNSPIQIVFDGVALNASNILYAGLTPGCAGLYQVNLRIPAGTSANPAVSIRFGAIVSPPAALAAVKAQP